ncbi:TolC family outer membrane protein [Marinibaculum pumilum]|uniref:TolC family outer membrane protein n=1 Tax=Marinibaculum pumilum TaxID=1766165 RepID=A0ABV7KWL0_9PROT
MAFQFSRTGKSATRRAVLASLIASTALAAGLGAAPVRAETLTDALVETYRTNPSLEAQRAALRATDENVPQALSGWRPSVSVSSSIGKSRVSTDNALIGGPNRTLTPISNSLTVSQPVYSGGVTSASTRAAEAQVEAARATLTSTEQSVLLNTVTAYFDVLQNQALVRLQQNNVQVLERQLEASEDRFRVGEITRTDVAQAEARLSLARSNLITAEGNLVNSRATYEQAVGRLPGALETPDLPPDLPGTVESAIEESLNINPTLQQAKFTELQSRHTIRATSGQLLPSVSVSGTAQQDRDTSQQDLTTNNFSLIASVSVPLYQSGSVYSSVRQARQLNSQDRIEIDQARRNVVQSVTQAWENLQTARSTIEAQRAQIAANRIALDGVIQEAQVGTRTTLDVLNAEQELLQAQVSLVQAERNEYVSAYTLLSSIGRLTAQSLQLPTDYYDPTVHYNEVRDKWWGTDGGLD